MSCYHLFSIWKKHNYFGFSYVIIYFPCKSIFNMGCSHTMLYPIFRQQRCFFVTEIDIIWGWSTGVVLWLGLRMPWNDTSQLASVEWKRGWVRVWPKSAEDLRKLQNHAQNIYVYNKFISIILYIMHVCMFTSMNACQGVCIHSLHMQHMHVHALVLVLTPRSILGASCILSIARRIPIPTTSEVHRCIWLLDITQECIAVQYIQYSTVKSTESQNVSKWCNKPGFTQGYLVFSHRFRKTAWGNYWELLLAFDLEKPLFA